MSNAFRCIQAVTKNQDTAVNHSYTFENKRERRKFSLSFSLQYFLVMQVSSWTNYKSYLVPYFWEARVELL